MDHLSVPIGRWPPQQPQHAGIFGLIRIVAKLMVILLVAITSVANDASSTPRHRLHPSMRPRRTCAVPVFPATANFCPRSLDSYCWASASWLPSSGSTCADYAPVYPSLFNIIAAPSRAATRLLGSSKSAVAEVGNVVDSIVARFIRRAIPGGTDHHATNADADPASVAALSSRIPRNLYIRDQVDKCSRRKLSRPTCPISALPISIFDLYNWIEDMRQQRQWERRIRISWFRFYIIVAFSIYVLVECYLAWNHRTRWDRREIYRRRLRGFRDGRFLVPDFRSAVEETVAWARRIPKRVLSVAIRFTKFMIHRVVVPTIHNAPMWCLYAILTAACTIALPFAILIESKPYALRGLLCVLIFVEGYLNQVVAIGRWAWSYRVIRLVVCTAMFILRILHHFVKICLCIVIGAARVLLRFVWLIVRLIWGVLALSFKSVARAIWHIVCSASLRATLLRTRSRSPAVLKPSVKAERPRLAGGLLTDDDDDGSCHTFKWKAPANNEQESSETARPVAHYENRSYPVKCDLTGIFGKNRLLARDVQLYERARVKSHQWTRTTATIEDQVRVKAIVTPVTPIMQQAFFAGSSVPTVPMAPRYETHSYIPVNQEVHIQYDYLSYTYVAANPSAFNASLPVNYPYPSLITQYPFVQACGSTNLHQYRTSANDSDSEDDNAMDCDSYASTITDSSPYVAPCGETDVLANLFYGLEIQSCLPMDFVFESAVAESVPMDYCYIDEPQTAIIDEPMNSVPSAPLSLPGFASLVTPWNAEVPNFYAMPCAAIPAIAPMHGPPFGTADNSTSGAIIPISQSYASLADPASEASVPSFTLASYSNPAVDQASCTVAPAPPPMLYCDPQADGEATYNNEQQYFQPIAMNAPYLVHDYQDAWATSAEVATPWSDYPVDCNYGQAHHVDVPNGVAVEQMPASSAYAYPPGTYLAEYSPIAWCPSEYDQSTASHYDIPPLQLGATSLATMPAAVEEYDPHNPGYDLLHIKSAGLVMPDQNAVGHSVAFQDLGDLLDKCTKEELDDLVAGVLAACAD